MKLVRVVTVPMSFMLLKGQLKFMSRHFNVIGVSSFDDSIKDVEDYEGVKISNIKLTRKITPLIDLVSLFKMIVFLIKEKPDIVHSHTPKAGLISMVASWIVRVPKRYHTVAGLPLMESKGIRKKILIFVERITYSCSSKVYPNSNLLKDYILKEIYYKPNKIKVIGSGSSNGIDLGYFNKEALKPDHLNDLKEQYQIQLDDFVYLFVGRIVKDKGINELLIAFDLLSKKYSKIKLLLVGNFEEELNPISNQSKTIIENNDRVFHVGFQKDVRPFFAISNVFVFPSYREGFPNVVLQSNAMEVPSIVSNINGSNEIVKNFYNGIIVPVKDTISLQSAMENLFVDQLLLNKLKSKTLESVALYSQEKIWYSLLEEYLS